MGLQGVLYLTDTSAENGAFVCIPGFHKRLGGWLQTLPPSMEHQPEFSLQLEFRASLLRLEQQGLGTRRYPGSKGDLVIWRTDIPHVAGLNRGDRPRLAQYVYLHQ